ncbi:hypothetical protein V6N13_147337 [Hibiscus sabdariffa]
MFRSLQQTRNVGVGRVGYGRESKENGKGTFANSAGYGVTVFVNYVSKRIHWRTLKEVFSAYGKVLRVFIAYNNARRIYSKSTFAFVRYASQKDAERAIEEGNGRRMDGFNITVELEKTLVAKKQPFVREQSKNAHSRQEVRKVYAKVTKDKSYKDALLERLEPQRQEESAIPDGQMKEKFFGRENINISASIPSSDLVNGEKFYVKVLTANFEDNRCWIDEGRVEFPSEEGCEVGGRCRFEERAHELNESTA